jgi:hypothetical protein
VKQNYFSLSGKRLHIVEGFSKKSDRDQKRQEFTQYKVAVTRSESAGYTHKLK